MGHSIHLVIQLCICCMPSSPVLFVYIALCSNTFWHSHPYIHPLMTEVPPNYLHLLRDKRKTVM